MPSLKILRTRKTHRPEVHLAISHIGGANTNSSLPWTLTVEEAIRTIELKHYNFIVMLGTRRAEVVVAHAKSGEKYLRCAADGLDRQTLLGLPDCA